MSFCSTISSYPVDKHFNRRYSLEDARKNVNSAVKYISIKNFGLLPSFLLYLVEFLLFTVSENLSENFSYFDRGYILIVDFIDGEIERDLYNFAI